MTYQDDMPANVQEGEFVMSREAVEQYGQEFLERMNEGARRKTGLNGMRGI